MKLIRNALLLAGLINSLAMPAAQAEALQGEKALYLLDKKQISTKIGTIKFSKKGELSQYSLHIDHQEFRDYFLSMKEMKCLEGPELWCHLPYPYQQPRTVTPQDLSWLSHDLLFMFKKHEEFGANFWNGIYYNMRIKDGEIIGEAEAIDLNMLASPPEDLSTPPISEAERDEIDSDKRWLPTLIIR